MPPKGSTKSQAKEPNKTPQVCSGRSVTSTCADCTDRPQKAKGKAAATPTSTKATSKKEDAKPVTPKKAKAAVTYTRVARDKKAVLPIDVTFPGDIAEAKQVKTTYTHTAKFEAGAPFTLFDSVSLTFSHFTCKC